MSKKAFRQDFISHKKYSKIKETSPLGPNGWLLFVACNAGVSFARQIKEKYEELHSIENKQKIDVPILGTGDVPITTVFSDSETRPRLPVHVAGADAYVFQCLHENITPNSVNENIQQLLQVVRTLRTHRARTITVVIPYSSYSRQDKPSFMKRESALASLFADQLKITGTDILLTYHPHTLSLYGFYEPEIKFVALSGMDLFEKKFERFKNRNDVVVASTDAGGAKATVHFSGAMNVSYAITSKFRGDKGANTLGIIGQLEGKKTAIITDDETVTGNSIINTIKLLNQKYGIKDIYVGISHFKIFDNQIDRFVDAHENFGLQELHITNTIPQKNDLTKYPFIRLHNLAEVFAATINKLHYNQSVSQIFSRL